MYHTRTFKGGAADHDPRQLTWAVFHCDVCGEDNEINITGRQGTFQFHVARKCPHCNSFGKEDKIISLKKEIEKLTENKTSIGVEIERLEKELKSLTSTEVNLTSR
jgi:hypothetical protein